MNPTVLIISPSPPFPRDYGNRNRVYQTWKFFERIGFEVSFLLYPFDTDWRKAIPEYYQDLKKSFYYFDVVSNSRPLHLPAENYHHDIDEWWDENLGAEIEWLTARKKFDVIFVNYTFYSQAFELFPKSVIKVLDTHDIFAGRREIFESNGVAPEFFYTNISEEKVAFDRAAIVIGIKRSETDFISEHSDSQSICIPYYSDSDSTHISEGIISNKKVGHVIRAGFIGAENSVNIVNMRNFLLKLQHLLSEQSAPLEIIVAGNVCKRLQSDWKWCKLIGRVEQVEDFYNQVDIIIAPLEFSTGIKIKVAEALQYGKPVISTKNAFDGYNVFHETQNLPSQLAVCQALIDVANRKIDFDDLIIASQFSAKAVSSEVAAGFAELKDAILSKLSRIYIFVGRPFWHRLCYVDEMIAQFVEYIAHMGQVTILCESDEEFNKEKLYADVEFKKVILKNIASDMNIFLSQFSATAIFDFTNLNDSNVDSDLEKFSTIFGYWKVVLSAAEDGRGCMPCLVRKDKIDEISFSPLRYTPIFVEDNTKNQDRERTTFIIRSNLMDNEVEVLKLLSSYVNSVDLNIVECCDYCEYNKDFYVRHDIYRSKVVFFLGNEDLDFMFIKSLLSLTKTKFLDIAYPDINDLHKIYNKKKRSKANLDSFFKDIISKFEQIGNESNGWDRIWKIIS